MKIIYFLLAITGTALLCGCDKQAKINSQKIDILAQKVVQLEQSQSRQTAALQSQLASLGPMLDKMNDFYFEKSHDEAFFFHTNTLYLLLTVDKKIESELRIADTERAADSSLAFSYHTNQMDATYSSAAQIRDALAAQEKRIEDDVNAETRKTDADLRDELVKQIKLSASDESQIARWKEMADDLAQIRRDLDAIKVQIGITNPPATRP
jgi:outer membrane murein-binding lipoprotein Lpp